MIADYLFIYYMSLSLTTNTPKQCPASLIARTKILFLVQTIYTGFGCASFALVVMFLAESWKNMMSILLLAILLFDCSFFQTAASTPVTYDSKALIIDGKRRILQSGSVHYPRTTPEVSSNL